MLTKKRPVESGDIGKQVVYNHETYVLMQFETRRVAYAPPENWVRLAKPGYDFFARCKDVFVVDPSDKDCTRCKTYASQFVIGKYGCSYCPTHVDGLLPYKELLEKRVVELQNKNDAYRELVKTLEKRLEEAEKSRDPKEGWTSCIAEVARAKYAEGCSVKHDLWVSYLFKGKSYSLDNRGREHESSTVNRAWTLSSAPAAQTSWAYKAPPK